MSQTILVTGGAGNLSHQLAHLLVLDGHRIVLFDIAPAPPTLPDGNVTYVTGDVTRPEVVASVLSQYQPQRVLHMASLLSAKSEEDRVLGWQINATATFQMLEMCVQHGVERFFFPSSVASFGGGLPDPLSEDQDQWPEGWYGVTKVTCERMGYYYHRRHGLDFRCLRIPQVISRFANPGAASAYASQAFVQGVQSGRFTFVVNPETCCAAVYVHDMLEGIRRFMDAPARCLTRRMYNIFSISPTAQEIAAAVRARVAGVQLDFSPDPDVARLIESWPRRIDDRSARADWGWSPQFDLNQMADDMVRDLLKEKQPEHR